MMISFRKVQLALLIGVVLSAPIFLNYCLGESYEDTWVETLGNAVAIPAMFFLSVLFPLAKIVPNPDVYILGAYFFLIPWVSIGFYAIGAYGIMHVVFAKK